MHPELKRSIEHWDGRIESLPHYRGCQVFPGEADVMPMRCTCGVTILAQRRLLKLPLYYLIRFRWHARCAIRRIHPVLRWKQQKGKQRKVCRWIHALAQDWAFYRCAATNLCWCSSRTPKPTPTDVPASDAECSASEIHFDTRLQIEYSSRVSAKAALIGIGVPNFKASDDKPPTRWKAAFLLSSSRGC